MVWLLRAVPSGTDHVDGNDLRTLKLEKARRLQTNKQSCVLAPGQAW